MSELTNQPDPMRQFWEELYDDFRKIAGTLQWGLGGHTLQGTAILNEAYIKIYDVEVTSRDHFINLVVRAMRQYAIDYARGKASQKRGGDRQKVPLFDHQVIGWHDPLDNLVVLDLLEHLQDINERDGAVAALRIMAGSTHQQIADALGLSERTVRTHWKSARAHLLVELGQDTES